MPSNVLKTSSLANLATASTRLLDHSDLGKGSKVTRKPYLLEQKWLKDWPLLGFFCLLEHIKGDWSPCEQFPCCPAQSRSDLALEQVGNDPLGNISVESIIYRSDGWSLCPFSLSLSLPKRSTRISGKQGHLLTPTAEAKPNICPSDQIAQPDTASLSVNPTLTGTGSNLQS